MNVINVVPMSRSSFPPKPLAPHTTVLRDEVVEALSPRRDGTYVDVTLGAGGHTEALLAAGAGRVVGFDRDATALGIARERLATFGARIELVHAPFSRLEDELGARGIGGVDGVVADLGISSMQLGEGARGMSFRSEGPLDMRMDRRTGETALELIDRLDDDDLTTLIAELGEERRARRVARCIKQAREAGELETTLDLRRTVIRAVGPARVGGIDPATKTFQALRIAVNDELGELSRLLEAASRCLVPGGVLAVISFHSLEDRLVKRMLREPPWELVHKKPVLPSEEEVDDNPRARSAKLRVARRRELDA